MSERVRDQLVEQQVRIDCCIAGQRRRRRRREAADEDGEGRQQPRLIDVELLPAPLDNPLHRGVPRILRAARTGAGDEPDGRGGARANR